MHQLSTAETSVTTEKNLANVLGTLVRLRYFVAGANRIGIECRECFSELNSTRFPNRMRVFEEVSQPGSVMLSRAQH